MNKTVNINIGGLFFHIDEDAYQKLSIYFDTIRLYLSNTAGEDEIMKDIEMRVAEILSENLKTDKHVINNKDIDNIINIMGQPEDYKIDDETDIKQIRFTSSNKKVKKLYRDEENGNIGGVCTGLGHYFGIDPIWIKIFFLVLVFAGVGSGILIYLILWIAVPKAETTAEKLEMTGNPVNISNIEKKVKEEFDSVSNKIKNADYDKIGNQTKKGIHKVIDFIKEVLIKVIKIFSKILGVFIVFISTVILISLIASVFTINSSIYIDTPWFKFIEAVNYSNFPIWTLGLLILIIIGIPVFFLLYLGLRLLINNLKPIGKITKYSLLGVWILAVIIALIFGIKQSSEIAFESKTSNKEYFQLTDNDTLKVEFKYNDFYTKSIESDEFFKFTNDSLNNEVIYSTDVSLHLKKTDSKTPYIQIEKKAKGKTYSDANDRAKKINYRYKIVNNKLILDNYLITDAINKYRNQKVEIYLYLPNGIVYYPDKSVSNYLGNYNSDFDYYYGPEGYMYKVDNSDLNCLNCPEEDLDSEESISIKINGDDIKTVRKKRIKKLKIDENGIIIKTE